MNGKSQQIKQTISKIDINKIANYPEHPQSRTLRRIIRYSQRIKASNNDQEIFKLGTDLAYYLNAICDPEKVGCVKDEQEKKYWLEISKEMFKYTIGIKEEKIKKAKQNC
jgi:hypothetical protein